MSVITDDKVQRRRCTSLLGLPELCDLKCGGQRMIANKRDFTSKPKLSDFARVLVEEMGKFDTKRYQVADHCGVSQRTVEDWQTGVSVPDTAHYKRLCGMFRRLNGFPPNWETMRIATIGERVNSVRADTEIVESKTRPVPTVKPEQANEPESFGNGLKRVMEANKINGNDLADVVGRHNSLISKYTSDENAPSQETLDRIYAALPELQRDVEDGKVEAPPVRAGKPRGPARKDAKPSPAIERPALMVLPAMPEPKPLSEPAANANTKPQAPDLDSLGAAYVKLRTARIRKSREVEELLGRIADLQQELAGIASDETAALAALDAVAAEGK